MQVSNTLTGGGRPIPGLIGPRRPRRSRQGQNPETVQVERLRGNVGPDCRGDGGGNKKSAAEAAPFASWGLDISP